MKSQKVTTKLENPLKGSYQEAKKKKPTSVLDKIKNPAK